MEALDGAMLVPLHYGEFTSRFGGFGWESRVSQKLVALMFSFHCHNCNTIPIQLYPPIRAI